MAKKSKNNNYVWIGIAVVAVVVLAIILISNGSFSKKVSQSDITLSSFKYEQYTGTGVPIHYDYNGNGQLEAEFSIIISTQRNDLYYKVYDAKTSGQINPSLNYAQKLSSGDNKFSGYQGLIMNSLGDSPELKVCISTNSNFDENSNGVVCKIQTFSPPEFKLEITPNPLTFDVSKSAGTYDTPHKTITVKNVGNIVAPAIMFIPSYAAIDPSYQIPKNYPQYITKTTKEYDSLQPGESYDYDVGVMIGNVGEFNTSVGTYESKGYVWGISKDSSISDALFKQEFTIKTTVNS